MDGAPGDRAAQKQTIRQTFAWRIVALRKPDLAGSITGYSYPLKITSPTLNSNYTFAGLSWLRGIGPGPKGCQIDSLGVTPLSETAGEGTIRC